MLGRAGHVAAVADAVHGEGSVWNLTRTPEMPRGVPRAFRSRMTLGRASFTPISGPGTRADRHARQPAEQKVHTVRMARPTDFFEMSARPGTHTLSGGHRQRPVKSQSPTGRPAVARFRPTRLTRRAAPTGNTLRTAQQAHTNRAKAPKRARPIPPPAVPASAAPAAARHTAIAAGRRTPGELGLRCGARIHHVFLLSRDPWGEKRVFNLRVLHHPIRRFFGVTIV